MANKTKMSFFYGLLFVISSAFLWGLSGGIASLLILKGWDPIVIATCRGMIGLIFMLGWLILSKNKERKISFPAILWSIVAGIGIAGNFGFYFMGISYTNVAVAVTLMYTAPIFVFLISALLKLEKFTFIKFLALIFISLGIVLLTGIYRSDLTSIHTWGIIYGLLSSLSYAIFIFSFKYSSERGNILINLNIAFLINSLILMIFANKQQLFQCMRSYEDIGWFLFLGFLGGGLSFFLYVTGLKSVSPAVASIVAMVEPVTASLFGVIVLGQFLTVVQTLGMLIILSTITILSHNSVVKNNA